MGDVIPFKRPSRQKQAEGKVLCDRGFHKWSVDKARQFDVKSGRLVTTERCKRCGATRTRAT